MPTTSTAIGPDATSNWHVREAQGADAEAIVGAVTELLVELGASPPPAQDALIATRELIEDPRVGAVLVVDSDREIVGVLAASWQSAIHIPGRYALIQDLWVSRPWRGQSLGAALLAALVEHAHDAGISRIEVGLPRQEFPGFGATEAFYAGNGFEPLGSRMRRVLP